MHSHGLVLTTTDRGEGPVFDEFFAAYDGAFVLPDEKEDREGLAICLALNHGPENAALTASFGPFRELCVVAHDEADGQFVGGANFIASPYTAADGTQVVTANLNYIFLAPEARGKGRFRALNAAVRALIAGLFSDTPADQVLIFIEQNDPFRMTREAYARDTDYTGMDQFDRLRIWRRLGAMIVDFPYVQPALSADQDADDTLVYSILGATGANIPADVLRHHLERFFHISVLKGAEDDGESVIGDQLRRLARMIDRGEAVPLIDPAPALERIGDPIAAIAAPPAPSFRDFARACRL
jgi:GNAT superfamily N-acetyltransferase